MVDSTRSASPGRPAGRSGTRGWGAGEAGRLGKPRPREAHGLAERPHGLSDMNGSGPDAPDVASGRAWIVESTIYNRAVEVVTRIGRLEEAHRRPRQRGRRVLRRRRLLAGRGPGGACARRPGPRRNGGLAGARDGRARRGRRRRSRDRHPSRDDRDRRARARGLSGELDATAATTARASSTRSSWRSPPTAATRSCCPAPTPTTSGIGGRGCAPPRSIASSIRCSRAGSARTRSGRSPARSASRAPRSRPRRASPRASRTGRPSSPRSCGRSTAPSRRSRRLASESCAFVITATSAASSLQATSSPLRWPAPAPVVDAVRAAGYAEVEISREPFRSGSLNAPFVGRLAARSAV